MTMISWTHSLNKCRTNTKITNRLNISTVSKASLYSVARKCLVPVNFCSGDLWPVSAANEWNQMRTNLTQNHQPTECHLTWLTELERTGNTEVFKWWAISNAADKCTFSSVYRLTKQKVRLNRRTHFIASLSTLNDKDLEREIEEALINEAQTQISQIALISVQSVKLAFIV